MKLSFKRIHVTIMAILTASSAAFAASGDVNEPNRQASKQNTPCSQRALTRFEKNQGLEAIDPTQIPPGLLLYSKSEILLESKAKPETQMVVTETPSAEGLQSKVVCANQSERDKLSLDSSVKALTKIEIVSSEQSRVTVRQYQVYMNDRKRGVVALNPRLQTRPVVSLLSYLSQMGGDNVRFFKLDERTYLMQAERDDGDTKLQLQMTYEFVEKR